MSTKLDIANSALMKCGEPPIMSFDDDVKSAKLIKNRYETVKRLVLRAHPWRSAMKRVVLAPLADPPVSGYSYQFQLPSDCIRVLPEDSLRTINYSVEADRLLCDATTLFLRYIKDEQDSQIFDEGLAEAIAFRLAYDLSYSLQQTAELRNTMKLDFDFTMKQAALWDSQSGGTLEVVSADYFIGSRVAGVDYSASQHNTFGGGAVPAEPEAPEPLPETPDVDPPVDPPVDDMNEQSGVVIVPQNEGTVDVVFPIPFEGIPAWVDCTLSIGNAGDPAIESHPDFSSKTATGFTAIFTARVPSTFYRLYWQAKLTV